MTPDCRGATACRVGGIEAERGGQFRDPKQGGVMDTFEPVKLARGVNGQFANTCGPYCLASVLWKYQGVLYTVHVKNGLKEEAIALANAAIMAGPRQL